MEIPNSFYCPISKQVMTDPVITPLGISYERSSIEEWLSTHSTCPVSNTDLTKQMLQPNRALKDTIDQLMKVLGSNVPKTLVTPDKAALGISALFNGREMLVSLIPSEGADREPNHICVVIDTSGSMSVNVTIQNSSGERETYNLCILDLVKYATKVIIKVLEPFDRLSIVSYNSSASVLLDSCLMTAQGKTDAEAVLDNLHASGQTNLWDGLIKGLELMKDSENINNTIFLLTDGQPNIVPPRGHLPMLQKFKDENKSMMCNINTFAFGYSADTKLMHELANEGNGTYNFIPDSGFVGTIFIHALANSLTTKFSNVILRIELDDSIDKNEIELPYKLLQTSWGIEVYLDTIRYGQSKDIVLPIAFTESQLKNTSFQLEFRDVYASEVNTVNYSNIELADNINIMRNHVRQQLIMAINLAYNQANTSSNLDVSKGIMSNVVSLIKQLKTTDPYILRLLEDAEGQLTEAVSKREYYDRWGKDYLPSLMMAHLHQQCNNFKDPGVQDYGGKLFATIRDKADDIFCNMEPPKPSVSYDNNYRGYRGSVGSSPPIPQSMAVFSQSSGPCFTGDCEVLMSNDYVKLIEDVRQGDFVKTPSGTAIVVCVTKTYCKNNQTILVNMKNGLRVTPYHPIRYNNEWQFPGKLIEDGNTSVDMSNQQCDIIYNFVLNKDHIMIINDYECCTLGHGFRDNSVIQHDYYGTGTVIEDLQKSSTWDKGYVDIYPNDTERDPSSNEVCKINCK